MSKPQGWARGVNRCETAGHNEFPAVSVSVQLSTTGGRSQRTQVRATAVRLCDDCLDSLAQGRMPKALSSSIEKAVKKVRGAA